MTIFFVDDWQSRSKNMAAVFRWVTSWAGRGGRHLTFAPLLLAALILGGCRSDGDDQGPSVPIDLRVDLLRGPAGVVSSATPRFSWRQPDGDWMVQSAYRVRVSAVEAGKGAEPLWDSGVVLSSNSQGVRYLGPSLRDGVAYQWTVQVWDLAGRESGVALPQQFHVSGDAGALPPRHSLVTSQIEPEEVIELGEGHLFVAFPAVAYGAPVLEFTGVHPPGDLIVEVGEHRVGNTLWRPAADGLYPESSIFYHNATIHTVGSAGRMRLDFPHNPVAGGAELPDGLTDIQPFRYVEIQGPAQIARGLRVLQQAVNYPFDETASHFHSSDPTLNDVWRLSRYTMKATSAFGLYVDGNRERLPYEADAYINQLGHYSVDAEHSLARYTNAYLLRNPSWPTEWMFHHHLLAWADYEHTGDESFIAAHYDDLVRFLMLPLARGDGLISTRTGLVDAQFQASLGLVLGPEDIVDWPAGERDDYDMEVQYNTVVNLFHWRSLDIMSRIAGVLGRADDEVDFRRRADQVRGSILGMMFDHSRGLFVDGVGSSHASLHANMFALAFDVVPDGFRHQVIAFVKSRGMAASVYGAQYLLEGLFRNGEDDYGVSLLTSLEERGWAHMIYDLGATIAHEAWDPRFKPNEDWNHAWGAAPANLIPRWLMGVRPLAPGFASFVVNPRPGPLEHADLRLPTVKGAIRVTYGRQGGARVLEVVVPANTSAFIIPPCNAARARFQVDGTSMGYVTELPPAGLGPFQPGRYEVRCWQ